MNTNFYPNDWAALAKEIKAANAYVCQECGQQCRRPGEMHLGWEYELTVAHYDNDYDAPAIFLVAICAPCHLRHDARFVWWARRRHERRRRLQAGQLEIFVPLQTSCN